MTRALLPRRHNPAAIGLLAIAFMAVTAGLSGPSVADDSVAPAFIDAQLAAHPGLSGVVLLERGDEALLARA